MAQTWRADREDKRPEEIVCAARTREAENAAAKRTVRSKSLEELAAPSLPGLFLAL